MNSTNDLRSCEQINEIVSKDICSRINQEEVSYNETETNEHHEDLNVINISKEDIVLYPSLCQHESTFLNSENNSNKEDCEPYNIVERDLHALVIASTCRTNFSLYKHTKELKSKKLLTQKNSSSVIICPKIIDFVEAIKCQFTNTPELFQFFSNIVHIHMNNLDDISLALEQLHSMLVHHSDLLLKFCNILKYAEETNELQDEEKIFDQRKTKISMPNTILKLVKNFHIWSGDDDFNDSIKIKVLLDRALHEKSAVYDYFDATHSSIGRRVNAFWHIDYKWHSGRVLLHNNNNDMYYVAYDEDETAQWVDFSANSLDAVQMTERIVVRAGYLAEQFITNVACDKAMGLSISTSNCYIEYIQSAESNKPQYQVCSKKQLMTLSSVKDTHKIKNTSFAREKVKQELIRLNYIRERVVDYFKALCIDSVADKDEIQPDSNLKISSALNNNEMRDVQLNESSSCCAVMKNLADTNNLIANIKEKIYLIKKNSKRNDINTIKKSTKAQTILKPPSTLCKFDTHECNHDVGFNNELESKFDHSNIMQNKSVCSTQSNLSSNNATDIYPLNLFDSGLCIIDQIGMSSKLFSFSSISPSSDKSNVVSDFIDKKDVQSNILNNYATVTSVIEDTNSPLKSKNISEIQVSTYIVETEEPIVDVCAHSQLLNILNNDAKNENTNCDVMAIDNLDNSTDCNSASRFDDIVQKTFLSDSYSSSDAQNNCVYESHSHLDMAKNNNAQQIDLPLLNSNLFASKGGTENIHSAIETQKSIETNSEKYFQTNIKEITRVNTIVDLSENTLPQSQIQFLELNENKDIRQQTLKPQEKTVTFGSHYYKSNLWLQKGISDSLLEKLQSNSMDNEGGWDSSGCYFNPLHLPSKRYSSASSCRSNSSIQHSPELQWIEVRKEVSEKLSFDHPKVVADKVLSRIFHR